MLTDGHCHPTDAPESLINIPKLQCRMVAMSTNANDLDLVSQVASQFPDKVIPAFGLHPWYSHLVTFDINSINSKRQHYRSILNPQPDLGDPILDLFPEPIDLEALLERIATLLDQHPNAIVGEIGLDKSFKVKLQGKLYPFKVKMEHQRRVLQCQLQLAKKYGRSVSLHGVGASQPLLDEVTFATQSNATTGKNISSVCLHSYGGTAEFYTQCWKKLPIRVYISVAMLINGSVPPHKLTAMLSGTDPSLVLSESDFNTASPYQVELVRQSLQLFAKHFNWTEAEAETRLESNFNSFIRAYQ